ncbi:LytR C-terminal domain-containing protein [Arcanobacterium hippocoleae]|uniref:LytR/CpsA/Psr regulator C-terminal domain-containing protein n=1 Tax=Arcanobacterium hippocoleae TaxID=149017 RepID=A0ABU1T1V1_9ACTO|nr:LytR C-terminal domain-containing protein [Arcanobacterium hippocoleae]MDR6939362.1 hypothetical protein [Arcanobacterium hippocoleae]
MNTYNDNARRAYRQRLAQRQIILFGTIGIVLAVLLLVNTLFWAGIVPFPFNKEFATNKVPEKVAVCPLAGAKPVELSQVKARVFNASSRSGLAQEVNSKLADQGVQVGSPANWESKEPVNESVRLLTKKDSIDAAYTLRAFFPEAKVVLDESAQDGVVDVVLGKGWNTMQNVPVEEDFQKAMEAIKDCRPAD